ncbi:MAG: dihydrolipoamide acetyltransferase family protein [Planctomycetota bacterium]|nr:dihydrolipoamide acetyltransferase family protein [Planctomycetota bacterium]
MPTQVTMPRLSDTMQAGTVVKWNVKEGQQVKSGDVIADIETDKATMELPTYDDGIVAKIAVAEGQSVPVGTLILVLAAKGEDLNAVKASAGTQPAAAPAGAPAAARSAGGSAAGAPAKSGGVAVQPVSAVAAAGSSHTANGDHAPANGTSDRGRVFASPLARKIANESGVDLGSLQGSGPSGRIIRKDVEAALAGGTAPASQAPAHAPAGTPARPAAPAKAAAQMPPIGAALPSRPITLSNMRRVIARRLVESKTTIPHYQVSVDVDMDALMSLRKQLNEQLESQGVKLSVNDFLVRACALAMHQHPYVNARWAPSNPPGNESIEYVGEVNVGIAIALPVAADGTGGGLVVGTVRRADQIGLRAISTESKRLAEKARAKGLSIEEQSDSTFAISNLGMFGVSHFNAIINPPNVAILAVGAALEKPVVRKGQVVPGWVMTMTLSSDHRVVDGAMAAQYLASVKDMLEKPASLLV